MHRFPFTYDVKGTVAEVVTAAVFRDAGCQVVPCGLHTLMPHVPALDKARYDALPEPLRRLPDLHILPPSGPPVWIETKFTKHFDRKAAGRIHRKVTAQLRHYPDLVTVVMRAEALQAPVLHHEQLLRVLQPRETLLSPGCRRWEERSGRYRGLHRDAAGEGGDPDPDSR